MNLLGPHGEPMETFVGGWRGEGDAKLGGESVLIVNETDLPDGDVESAVASYWLEESALNFGSYERNSFQTYANQGGSLLTRAKFHPPANVFEEMKLARDLAERDDDVRSALGSMHALAFGDGWQHTHEDETTVALFDEVADNMGLDSVQAEMYRELLITGQVIAITLFTRETYSILPQGTDRYRSKTVVSPLVGCLPAENVRIIGNDLFGNGPLWYFPEDEAIRQWLRRRFDPNTSPGMLAQMRGDDPVAFALFTEEQTVSPTDPDASIAGLTLYRLNPRMVSRTHYPKGAWKYPRPLMTSNFALLEAKRLLNIMDYALLQGGANYIVVAKKGSDQKPAMPGEVDNLRDVIRRAGRTGVLVGDHRVSIDILTPELKELLNPEKRNLLGRKLARAMLRIPDFESEGSATEGMKADVEILTRVISSDRRLIKCHIEGKVYGETAKRNPNVLTRGPACLWYPKIVLQGTQFFTDMILKLLDRGAIPLKYAVEYAGFDFDAAVAEKKRQKSAGLDKLMMPAPGQVPHSSPNTGPQDNGPGRPPGGQDPAAPRPTIRQTPGETIKAIYEDALGRVVRVGDTTYSILEEYVDTKQEGRVSAIERQAVDLNRTSERAGVIVVPVNPEAVESLKAVRLDEEKSISLIVGQREEDGALVTKAISFRSPDTSVRDAEERAMAWGFTPMEAEEEHASQSITVPDQSGLDAILQVLASAVVSANSPPPPITIHVAGDGAKRVVYDEDGRVKGVEPVEE